jgi:hypothetical protein
MNPTPPNEDSWQCLNCGYWNDPKFWPKKCYECDEEKNYIPLRIRRLMVNERIEELEKFWDTVGYLQEADVIRDRIADLKAQATKLTDSGEG